MCVNIYVCVYTFTCVCVYIAMSHSDNLVVFGDFFFFSKENKPFIYFILYFWPHSWHVGVPRLGINPMPQQ